jgi:hypothetical protein
LTTTEVMIITIICRDVCNTYVVNANVGNCDDNSVFGNRHRRTRLGGGREKREFIKLIDKRKNCIFNRT